MNKTEAIAALGGPESARVLVDSYIKYGLHEYQAIATIALSALDAPSDGWAALENARAWAVTQRDQCKDEEQRNKNTSDPYWRGCALAFEQAIGAIDRELDARPAKEPGLDALLASAKDHKMTDEEREAQRQSWAQGNVPFDRSTSAETASARARAEKAEKERGHLAAIVRGDGGHGTFEEALEQASWLRADKGELLARAEKAEAEVARLTKVVEKIKEATK